MSLSESNWLASCRHNTVSLPANPGNSRTPQDRCAPTHTPKQSRGQWRTLIGTPVSRTSMTHLPWSPARWSGSACGKARLGLVTTVLALQVGRRRWCPATRSPAVALHTHALLGTLDADRHACPLAPLCEAIDGPTRPSATEWRASSSCVETSKGYLSTHLSR